MDFNEFIQFWLAFMELVYSKFAFLQNKKDQIIKRNVRGV